MISTHPKIDARQTTVEIDAIAMTAAITFQLIEMVCAERKIGNPSDLPIVIRVE